MYGMSMSLEISYVRCVDDSGAKLCSVYQQVWSQIMFCMSMSLEQVGYVDEFGTKLCSVCL